MKLFIVSAIAITIGCAGEVAPFEIGSDTAIDISSVRLPPDTEQLEELPPDTEQLEELPTDTEGLEELPTDTEGLEELPLDTEQLEELPTDTEQLQELPTDTEGLEELPLDTAQLEECGICSPCFDCDACRHGSIEENAKRGCEGHLSTVANDCGSIMVYVPAENDTIFSYLDPSKKNCDRFICCEELPNESD